MTCLFRINEETFWRNYFYRVSLIKQSTQLSALTHENGLFELLLIFSIIYFSSLANAQSTDETHGSSKDRSKYPIGNDSFFKILFRSYNIGLS
jgi:hypothetical protein